MRFPFVMTALVAVAGFAFVAGVHRGVEVAPFDSELASAQELTGDKDVHWIGYLCGDDSATIVTRDMPGTDCKESRRLSDVASFGRPL
jgi:hypothetical protein